VAVFVLKLLPKEIKEIASNKVVFPDPF